MSVGAQPTILLVEDEAPRAAEFSRALSHGAAAGCTVWHAESAADARAVLKRRRPDLIVLDVTLPDVDGLVLCTQLKTEAPDVPLMICGAATTAEKVLGLKLGAEDVVTRAIELPELEARVEAILRRRALRPAAPSTTFNERPSQTSPYSLGKLRVDVSRCRVTLDNRPLELTPTEFQLLVYLAHRPGEIVSRRDLAHGVWGDEGMASSRTIDAYVRRVGAKLRGPDAPRLLNIRGFGYQLAVPMVSAA